MTEHICPSCHCSFKQEFLCTTCGAEKLKDETTKQLERALHSKAEALMMQTNEIERLRDLLGKANALCRIRQGRIKELVSCIERMRVAGGSHEFQMAFEFAKDAIGHGKDTTLTDMPEKKS